MSTYKSDFEEPFLEATSTYYDQLATHWISIYNAPEYLKEIDGLFNQEEQNADYWLPNESKKAVIRILARELVSKRAESVIEKESGALYMFQNNRLKELKLMYNVFKRDDSLLEFVIEKMGPYIEFRGEAITSDNQIMNDPVAFTKKLIELRTEIDLMLRESFDANNVLFQRCRDNSFANFMNKC